MSTLRLWVILGILLMVSFTINIFFWDFFSGTDTQGFAVLDPYVGLAMFYVYMVSFFTALFVMFGVVRTNKFGAGLAIWTPYAVIGIFVESYFELIVDPVLKGFWAVVLYCMFGLLSGLAADISFHQLIKRYPKSPALSSALSAIIMNFIYFLGIVIALSYFYKAGNGAGSFSDPGSFLGVAYFGIPWMVIQSFAGGYLAYTLWIKPNPVY